MDGTRRKMAHGFALLDLRRAGACPLSGTDARRERAFRRRLRGGCRDGMERRVRSAGRGGGISSRRRDRLGHPLSGSLGALLYRRIYLSGILFRTKSLFHALRGCARHGADILPRQLFSLRRRRYGPVRARAGSCSCLRRDLFLPLCPEARRRSVRERRDPAQRLLHGALRARADEPCAAAAV